jgi:hypothetical protein
VEVPKGRRFPERLASILVDVEVPPARRLQHLRFAREAARRRKRAAVKTLLLGGVLAAGIGIVASVANEVVASRRGTPTLTSSSEPAALLSVRPAPPAGVDANGADTHTEAEKLPRLELLTASELQIGAMLAEPEVAQSVPAVPSEMPSAPANASSEGLAKPGPSKSVRPREKNAGSAPQPARVSGSRGNVDAAVENQPDPAEIIDWLLKESAPKRE